MNIPDTPPVPKRDWRERARENHDPTRGEKDGVRGLIVAAIIVASICGMYFLSGM